MYIISASECAMEKKSEDQQIEQKIKSYKSSGLFKFHYWVLSKNVLVKTEKPQLCYCPWRWSVGQAEGTSLNPAFPFEDCN